MGPIERRQREREEIRTRILDAARELFVAEGYEAVTMRRIADRIEYSPTAIYFHFKDKDALMGELCAVDFYTLATQLTKIARVEDPIERLRRIGKAYAGFAAEFPNHYRLMFMTPHPVGTLPEDAMQRHGNPEEDAYAFLKATVAEAIAQNRLKPEHDDAELVSQTMWAGVHGVVSLHIAKECDPWVEWRSIKTRVSTMIDILVDGLSKQKRSK
ncbi:MAG TPA: TetR/AcrR family transcriptional regulator [Thermoanaerobaculia bacterium]|nr:TetR/AcrR family transcriptional regulator [Thermoanaerobaculia bacterium]